MLNDHTAFRVDWMPFAGLRQSGLGAGGIPYTFREMQIEKLFVGPVPLRIGAATVDVPAVDNYAGRMEQAAVTPRDT